MTSDAFVIFYFQGKKIKSWHTNHIPKVGESVSLNLVKYKVLEVSDDDQNVLHCKVDKE